MEARSRAATRDVAALLDAIESTIDRDASLTPSVRQRLAALQAKIGVDHPQRAEVRAGWRAQLVDELRDSVFLLRASDVRVLEVNDAAVAAYGYTRDEFTAMTPRELRAEAERADVDHQLREVLARGSVFETRHQKKDGTVFPVEINARGVEVDGDRYVVAVVRDVTERKRAEAALRESEARFRAIFEAAPVGVEVSRDGGALFVNGLCAKLFGYDHPEALVGVRLCDRIAASETNVRARVCVADPVEAEYESLALRRDGTAFPVLINVIRVRLPDGPAAMLFFRDLTEREQARAARERVEAQLRHSQKMEAIGTLAGGIAHDFNNILTPIVAHCDLALASVDELSPVFEDLSAIGAAASRARVLVKQMLAISRREEVRTSLHPVDLGRLIGETVRLLRAALPASIHIETLVAPDSGCVPGDATQLHQVLLNLCTNARDAMESGGTLTVALAREHNTAASGRAHDRVWLTVRDTGEGMTAEVQQRIFEPYFTTKPSGKGTGLGLAVVHGIVTRMGGELRVRSAPGRGTAFEVFLPRCPLPDDASTSSTS